MVSCEASEILTCKSTKPRLSDTFFFEPLNLLITFFNLAFYAVDVFFFITAALGTTDLKETGRVLTLGQGDVGQLGLGEDILERKKPAIVKGLDDLDIVQVECGGMHTVALTNKGKVSTAKLVIQTHDFVIFIAFALQVKCTMSEIICFV